MKYIKILILVMVVFIISGCTMQKENNLTIPTFDNSINIHSVVGIENETDYDNIKAIAEQECFNKDINKIRIKIINNNVGKGFYMYSIPSIQIMKNKVWQNVEYNNPDIPQWLFIGEEGNHSMPNYTYCYINSENIKGGLKTGEYRIAIFAPDNVIYSYFSYAGE